MACPAKGQPVDRVILEMCTSNNSRIGQQHPWSTGCLVVRITADDDLTSQHGIEKALKVVEQYWDLPLLIWVSIPCTGGSSWQNLNRKSGKCNIANINAHIALYRALMRSVSEVVSKAKNTGQESPSNGHATACTGRTIST